MKKAPSVTRKPAFSLIEVVLAISLFAVFSLSSVSILLYSEENFLSIGQSSRASFLAEEAIEAARAVKNEDFTLLTDGDHGISSSSGKWQFSGTEDAVDGFTRRVSVNSLDPDTKKIATRVSWLKKSGQTASVNYETQLTNWSAYSGIPGFGNWAYPFIESSVPLTGGKDGVKIQAKDNFLYVVRDSAAQSFTIIDVTDTKNPIVKSENNLRDNPKNIHIHNNLALIATKSNSAELQIADITDPAAPAMKGVFDAQGIPDASGITAKDNYAYLTRMKGDGPEFYIIDISNPDEPTEVGSLELNRNGNEVVVMDNYAYIASGPNGKQLSVVDISNPAQPNLVGSHSLILNQNALTITGFEKTVIIGTELGVLYVIDVSSPASPQPKSVFFLKDGILRPVRDITFGLDNHYLFIASDVPNREFQVFDVSGIFPPPFWRFLFSPPFFIGSFDTPAALYGVAYSNEKDRAFVTGVANDQSVIILAPQ